MGLEKGSPAYLAIDKDLSFGDVFECPVAGWGDAVQRFRITAIGEHHVLVRRCGLKTRRAEWEGSCAEGPEELALKEWIDGATRVD